MKQSNMATTLYDEASSSSSSGSSSSDEDDEDHHREEVPQSGSEEEEEGSSSSSDEEEQAETLGSSVGRIPDDPDESSSTSSSTSPTEHDATDLTLQERLHRTEARGLRTLNQQRQRKRTVLEVASERLAKLKRLKTEKARHQGNEDDDDDDEEDGPLSSHNNSSNNDNKKRKKSKHAPTEVSSKRSEFFRRGPMRLNESGLGVEIGANRYKPVDPRTNSLNGHLNEEQFEKSYEFLQEMRDKEMAQLKKQIAVRKETGKKGKRKRRQMNLAAAGSLEEDEARLLQLKQEKADFERRKIERAAKRIVKNKIKTEVEEGKRGVYFLKRKEKKTLEFEAKIEEIRKRGGHKAVEKILEKRRKKAKSRDSSLFAK